MRLSAAGRLRSAAAAAFERGRAPGFFYLDRDDTRSRAALLTWAVRRKVPTRTSLKLDYARTLARIGKTPLNSNGSPRVVSEGPILGIARSRRMVDRSVRPSSYGPDARVFARRSVHHALTLLALQHPPLSELCDLLITDILVWPSVKSGGGSTSNLLGVIWLLPAGELTSLDIAESIIHEMVHMNLHLADMTVGLYTRLPGHDFEAYSAVLGRRRPHHHAFHSACVAVTIIYFRLLLGLNEEIASRCAALRRCTSELMQHRGAFSRYAWSAIRAAHAFSLAPRLSAIPVHRELMKLPRSRAPAQRRSRMAHSRRTNALRSVGTPRKAKFSAT